MRHALSGLVLAGLVLSGCAHRVEIVSEPAGASVTFDRRGAAGLAPVAVQIWDVPLSRPGVRIALVDYRTVHLDLRREIRPFDRLRDVVMLRWSRAFSRAPRATHHVVLVPRHGPAGTWSPEDVPH